MSGNASSSENATRPPHLRKTKTSSQLIVNGSPFLMLAAELHNSSLSSASYMSTVYPEMRRMNVNTLLGSVTWEMIEPEEGRFDFSELDKCLDGARQNDMRLVLLWFGSFKNALSTYVPSWVKQDVQRFPRVHIRDHDSATGLQTLELLSPLSEEAWQADARAFSKLMEHLKLVDQHHHTVLMVQVENEIGLLGDARDRSSTADELFNGSVPADLLDYLHNNFSTLHTSFQNRFPELIHSPSYTSPPSWSQIFGDNPKAEEMFMADAFARYTGQVARAGKTAYDIPLYVNCWLNYDDASLLDLDDVPGVESAVVGGGAKPGVYPSGGPVPHCIDIFKFHSQGALDFVAPDLYFHDYESVCREYRHGGQPLFIPEQRRDEKGARRVWLAYGTYGAIGCSPFGIDTLTAANSAFTRHYGLLNSMSKYILEAQAQRPEEIFGFFFDDPHAKSSPSRWTRQIGGFELIIERAFVFGTAGPGAGMVIKRPSSSNAFLLIGWGFQVTFRATDPEATFTGILRAKEMIVGKDGELSTGRIMNGDETRSGAFYIMPNEDPDYGGFPIAVTIPCRTMVAEVEPYCVFEKEF